VHKKETDEMQTNNNNNNNNSILSYSDMTKLEEPQSAPLSLVTAPTPPSDTPPQKSPESSSSRTDEDDDEGEEDVEDEETEDDEDAEEDAAQPEQVVRDRNDEQRYEPVTEEFLFEGEMIKPCYCVLPFVTDEEVEAITQRSISVSFVILEFDGTLKQFSRK
jgi:cobalamin biosynthesis protein CobT